jgi:hypothetical protein
MNSFEGQRMPAYSKLRSRLASFEHAYVLALRLRSQTGVGHYVVRTNDLVQPVRVVSRRPLYDADLLAEIW